MTSTRSARPRPDGECTGTSIFFGDSAPLPLLEMYTKVNDLRTGRAHARPAMPRMLELIASGALHPELVTTRVVDWAEAAPALSQPDWTKLVTAQSGATSL